MDELDRKILRRLAGDGRCPYQTISNEQGVSIGTVHNRVRKMMDEGIMTKFSVDVNLERFGYSMTTITMITLDTTSNADRVRNELKKFKESVVMLYHMTGNVDFIMINKFKDMIAMREFNRGIAKIPGIRSETNIVMNAVKEDGLDLQAVMA